jgi:CHAT domain-containing protein/Tfp pilus assembly protein PilF
VKGKLRLLCCTLFWLCSAWGVGGWAEDSGSFKTGVLVLPFQASQGVPADDVSLGMAVQNVLEHMLILHSGLEESWFFWHLDTLFPRERDLHTWLRGRGDLPPGVRDVRLRYLITGHVTIQGETVRAHLTLLDRAHGQQRTREAAIDLPGLERFRRDVLELLAQAGIPAPEAQKPKMLWHEDLTLPAFVLLGQGLYEDFVASEYRTEQSSSNRQPFEDGLRLSPQSYLLRNALGWLAYRQRRYAEAITLFEQALAVNPTGADAADGMVKAAHRLGDEALEETWAREQARLQGQDVQVALGKLHNRRGHAAYERQDYAAAASFYEQAIRLDPTKVAYVLNAVEAYSAMQRFEVALQALEAAQQRVSFAEDAKALHLARARLYRAWGDSLQGADERERAIAHYQAALAIDTIYQPADAALDLLSLGKTLAALQRYDQAIASFEQALVVSRELPDQQSEVLALLGLAMAYRALGNTNREVARLQEALALAGALQNREAEGEALLGLGLAHHTLNRNGDAVDYLEQALARFRASGDRRHEGDAWHGLGVAWEALGQADKAIDAFEQALVIARQVHDRRWEGQILRKAGWLYERTGQEAKGITYLEQAVALARETGHSQDEGGALSDLTVIYRNLGSYEKAIVYAEQALTLARQVEGRESEGTGLVRLGWPHLFLGRYDAAAGYFAQAFAIARKINRRDLQGEALRGLCAVPIHAAFDGEAPLGPNTQTVAHCEQALAIERARQDRRAEASILSYLAAASYVLTRYDSALRYAEQELALSRERRDRKGEQSALHNLMAVWRKLRRPDLAIFYGKQAVNGAQAVRRNLRGLGQDLQENFLRSWEDTYRTLADLLIAQGRLPEAQQVLDLLKREEYLDFVRRDAKTAESLQGRADLNPQEAAWEARYRQIADRVTAIGAEYDALRAQKTRSAAENQRLAQLGEDLIVARQAFQQLLDRLAQESDYVTPGGTTVAELREAQALMGVLRKLGSGAVALYTLVGEEKYQVIVITPHARTAREYPISRQQLNRKVAQFRQVLWDRTRDPVPLAQELYRILIGPIAQDLRGAKAETLMWSLDGTLRYIPIAALHDGERYFVERYRNVVFTPASQLHLQDPPTPIWRGLGLGISKEHEGFEPLPSVPKELRGIIRETGKGGQGILPGKIMLDEAFTQASMLAALQQRYSVVHIASHFHLQPGSEQDSFLLLGNGKLSVAQMKALQDRLFEDIELLTLSACNTAMGGRGDAGKEIESFGVEAQRQGAKAVIATLWPVADDSTRELMQTFYRLRQTHRGMVKAEALRQAQLQLLRPAKSGKARYAHPYYWAPFILIGNWR